MGGVAEIDNVFGGEELTDSIGNREPADAGIKNADGRCMRGCFFHEQEGWRFCKSKDAYSVSCSAYFDFFFGDIAHLLFLRTSSSLFHIEYF